MGHEGSLNKKYGFWADREGHGSLLPRFASLYQAMLGFGQRNAWRWPTKRLALANAMTSNAEPRPTDQTGKRNKVGLGFIKIMN